MRSATASSRSLGEVLGAVNDGDEVALSRVREGEDSFEVIVVRRSGDTYRALPHTACADVELTSMAPPEPRVARQLAAHTVTLPSWLCRVRPDGRGGWVDILPELEDNGMGAWQESPWLRGQLVLVLDDNCVGRLGNHCLEYDDVVGLTIRKA